MVRSRSQYDYQPMGRKPSSLNLIPETETESMTAKADKANVDVKRREDSLSTLKYIALHPCPCSANRIDRLDVGKEYPHPPLIIHNYIPMLECMPYARL